MNNASDFLIRAAGGLVWRTTARGPEILLVHRSRYGDWTLPKGKLDEGEDWQTAARREVREETGREARLESFAGIISYMHGDRPKVVLFWNMRLDPEAPDHSAPEDTSEVKRAEWLPVDEALKRLQYAGERDLLARSGGAPP